MTVEHEAPWLNYYGEVPQHLEYESGSMYDMLRKMVERYPEYDAYEFMGRRLTYRDLDKKTRRTARAFRAAGISEGDRVMVCLPNLPQTVDCLYALNLIGAVSAFVHPLSTRDELGHYLSISNCAAAVVLDQFAAKFQGLPGVRGRLKVIITHVSTELRGVKRLIYRAAAERKHRTPPDGAEWIDWDDFLEGAAAASTPPLTGPRGGKPAVILFTGGSTGTPKGALLSNLNLNALALQTVKAGNASKPGSTMLAIMPMFHGFGLGVGVHTALGNGGTCILIPRFTPKSYAKILRKQKPNYIAGVPTLYEALLRLPSARKLDLSFLMGVFSGGDSMTPELRRRVDAFLTAHGSPVRVREGYGLTECVSASCLTPELQGREGSIGIPFPDTYYKIVRTDTAEERAAPGEEGEICLSGPTVMLGYVDQPDESGQALRRHGDGRVWLHTGDLGRMDADGFLYFHQRIKRMIVTNGYNVYPSQVERVLEAHGRVQRCCVIGVADAYRGQRVKAFVIPKSGVPAGEALRRELDQYLHEHVISYACPREISFVGDLPITVVGKVDYLKLMQKEAAGREKAGDRETGGMEEA